MFKSPLRETFYANHLLRLGALPVLVLLACLSANAAAQTAQEKIDPAVRPEFREPVVLRSKEGVLEIRLTARQGQATLDTVARPVRNFLVFDYEVVRGQASNGQSSGGNLYPAPTLQVFPGETLIVHLENDLAPLTIRDFFSPQYTAKGQPVPIYPDQMISSPLNLHIHGAHISPKGNADNVMLHIPPGNVQHLHLRDPKEHAARTLLVPFSSAWAHLGASLYGSCRSACDRTNGWQSWTG